jgi:hypothetical protein
MNRNMAALASALLISGLGKPAHAQASYCRTNADTANLYVKLERLGASTVDTAYMRSHGLPYAPPSAVALVTANNTCKAAVSAYNKTHGLSGSRAIASVYVLAIGSAGYVVINPLETTGNRLMKYLYNRSWVLMMSVAG